MCVFVCGCTHMRARPTPTIAQTRHSPSPPFNPQVEEALEAFVEDQIVKHDDNKWGNKLSSKLFVAREFVVKHIRNKHGGWARQGCIFYVLCAGASAGGNKHGGCLSAALCSALSCIKASDVGCCGGARQQQARWMCPGSTC